MIKIPSITGTYPFILHLEYGIVKSNVKLPDTNYPFKFFTIPYNYTLSVLNAEI